MDKHPHNIINWRQNYNERYRDLSITLSATVAETFRRATVALRYKSEYRDNAVLHRPQELFVTIK